MTGQRTQGISRRGMLGAAGTGLAGLGVVGLPSAAWAHEAPLLWSQPDHIGAPEIHGLHLQFGADASREVVVSWFTPQSVARPRVFLGTAADGLGHDVAARTLTYTD